METARIEPTGRFRRGNEQRRPIPVVEWGAGSFRLRSRTVVRSTVFPGAGDERAVRSLGQELDDRPPMAPSGIESRYSMSEHHVRSGCLRTEPRTARVRWPVPLEHRRISCSRGGQCPPPRLPASASCRRLLGPFMPVMVSVVPRDSYLVVIASSAATVEASQTCASERSMTTFDGSFA